MGLKPRILLVEKDADLRDYLLTLLFDKGYEPLLAHSGAEAISMSMSHCPEVMLMDAELSDNNADEIISKVRTWSAMPILVYSEQTEESEKVKLLDLGADDYMVKPCGDEELLARLRVAMRHTRTVSDDIEMINEGKLTLGSLQIDYNRFRVYMDKEDVNLTANEYRIVALLGKYAGKVLRYENIIQTLWGPKAGKNNQILRVNMTNIRKKIKEDPMHPKYIFTENGIGYRLVTKEELE